jgi:isopenicillin-N N-acyltransferase-like protein
MAPIILGKNRSTGRRWLRGLGVLAFVAVILVVIANAVVLRVTAIRPPPAEPAAELPLTVRGPRANVGGSWMTRERGMWELHLEGDPYAMGYAHARLGNRLMIEAEDYMFDEMRRYVPSSLALALLRIGVRYRYRHLPEYIPLDRQREIAGEARAALDRHADFLPTYHRFVFYHALHDITQGLEHSPLLGCSAFAAAGPATTNGHLIIGRNFDFEGPEPFDRNKAVLFFKPEGKIPFASVAWPGMTGVVTGLNAAGIYMSINAARTDDKGEDGIPVELLVREVLENARSIDEAVAIVKRQPVMVPDFYLMGDGKTGESAVIERSPTRTEVRRSRDTTLLTNHALTPAFAKDVENDRLRRYTTSGARYRRLAELVEQNHGAIDPRRALDILRDKKGVGGAALGLGNRNALDAIIATHSVVVDATALQLWVSQGPHCLGRYVGYDLRKELLGEDHPTPPDLPADPVMDSDEYRAYVEATAQLGFARSLAEEGHTVAALEAAERAAELSEMMPEPHKLLGDLLRDRDRERARKEYRRFLELQPPYLHEIEEVRGILSSL